MITATATLTGTITATAQIRSIQTGGCPDNVATVNSTPYATAASGTTINVDVEDTAGADVGSLVGGKWQIGDSTNKVNGVDISDPTKAEGEHDQQIHDSTGVDVGTAANPSVISNSPITSSGGAFSDSVRAQQTYTIANVAWTDSDGSPQSTEYSQAITCTPADYGTRILSVLRRQYCRDALCGFSLRYIEDDFADNGSAVIRVRRSSDNSEQDFTPTEITDGTLTTFTGAGDGHVTIFYDQTGNFFEMYNTTAGNQGRIVTSGTLNTDSQGNPTVISTSTQGYFIGANGSNASQMTLFSPNGAFWIVGKKQNSTTISRAYTASGNPSIGIADTTGFDNANGTGSPVGYVNGVVLADSLRSTLQTAINDTEHILFMEDAQWTDSGTWRTNTSTAAFQNYQVGTQISEFVLSKKDWSDAAVRSLILTDTNSYYSY